MASGRRSGGRIDLCEHLGKGLGAGEIDVELGASSAAKVCVGIVEAGKDESAGAGGVEIVENRFGSSETRDLFGGSDGEDFAAADCDGFNDARLVFSKSFAGV